MTTTVTTNTVDCPCEEYDEMKLAWALPKALMGGTREMRKAGQTYLPKEPLEADSAYRNRLARSVLYNAYRKTVQNLSGRVFAKPIVLQKDVPATIAPLTENVDLTGRHINQFARDVFTDGFGGLSHILVEMPPKLPDGATLEDERAQGRRPYWVHVKHEDLIGWKSEMVGGRHRLTQVRIRETYFKNAGEWHATCVTRIRVLTPGAFQIWEAADGGFLMVEEGVTSLPEIPLATYYAERTGFMTARPLLEDLAYTNSLHWQSSSDQQNILHVTRVPLLFGSGFPQDFKLIQAGADSAIMGPSADAKLQYVEHGGKAIEAGRTDLLDLEQQMQILGMEVLMPKTGQQTATAKAIDSVEANSQLAMMAGCLGDALEQALGFTAQYLGLGADAGGSVAVNTDYGVSVRSAEDVKNLIEARRTQEISRETFLKELKRRGLLMDDFDVEAELTRIEDEMPEPMELDEDPVRSAARQMLNGP